MLANQRPAIRHFAVAAKPVWDDGRIYVGSFDGQLHVLDAADGTQLWTYPTEPWVWGGVAVADACRQGEGTGTAGKARHDMA